MFKLEDLLDRRKLAKVVQRLVYDVSKITSISPEPSLKVVTKSSGGTLDLETGNYYRFSSSVDTLSVSLVDSGSDTGIVKGLVVSFTTGSNPTVTITAKDGKNVKYFSGYTISANTTYELNIIFNGTEWIVGYGIVS